MINLASFVPAIASSTTAFFLGADSVIALAISIPLAFFIMMLAINVLFRHKTFKRSLQDAEDAIAAAWEGEENDVDLTYGDFLSDDV